MQAGRRRNKNKSASSTLIPAYNPAYASERASTPVQFDREVNVEMLMWKQNCLSKLVQEYVLAASIHYS